MSLFRWKKGEHEAWYKKINRFNKKIKEAIKSGYKYDLPEAKDYKTELNRILSDKDYTREHFNKEMKFIDNFLNKNALDLKKGQRGARIPVWEFKDIKNRVLPQINKKRMEQKKRLQEEEATDRGKKIGYKAKEVEELATNRIREKSFNWKYMSNKDFEKFKETLWEFNQSIEESDKQMYRNYKKAIYHELDTKDAWELRKLVNSVPVEYAIKKIYNDLNLGFNFVYSKVDYDNRYRALKGAWKQIVKDYEQSLRSD